MHEDGGGRDCGGWTSPCTQGFICRRSSRRLAPRPPSTSFQLPGLVRKWVEDAPNRARLAAAKVQEEISEEHKQRLALEQDDAR